MVYQALRARYLAKVSAASGKLSRLRTPMLSWRSAQPSVNGTDRSFIAPSYGSTQASEHSPPCHYLTAGPDAGASRPRHRYPLRGLGEAARRHDETPRGAVDPW